MSRMLTLSALSLLSIASAAVAAPGPPANTSGYTIGATPRSVSVRRYERPATPVCARSYLDTGYSSRPYCPDTGETRQLFITGQVVPAGFGIPIGYSQLNSALRAEYRLDAEPDYVFAAGYLYAIDHGNKTVKRIIPVEIAR